MSQPDPEPASSSTSARQLASDLHHMSAQEAEATSQREKSNNISERAMPPASEVVVLKRLVRAQVKETLEKLSHAHVVYESQRVVQNVLRTSVYQKSEALACYLTMEKQAEVETRQLVQHALNSGKRVYVPRVNHARLAPKGSKEAKQLPNGGRVTWMSMLRLYSVQDMKGLKKSPWGIPEPEKDDGPNGIREDLGSPFSGTVDLIIMPGVAFDYNLSRLGHGAGYYDKWLTQYAQAHGQGTRSTLMGVALSEQIVPQIPIEPHDWPLDLLVTPEGILPAASAEAPTEPGPVEPGEEDAVPEKSV